MAHSVEKMEQLLGISSSHGAVERPQYSRLSKHHLNAVSVYNFFVYHWLKHMLS